MKFWTGYMRKKLPDDDDIITPKMTDNETWNTCPECGKYWKDEITIPGLLHRTRLCDKCFRRERALMQPEDLDE